MIYYFKPFATDKKIGRVYNAHCAIVPNSADWICCMDYDAMILTPETFQVIEAAIARYPDTAIFGAFTNRIAYPHQRITPHMEEYDGIRYHTTKAIELAEKYADGECEEARSVAGFFMLFRKEYWMKSPFQENIYDDRNNLFDFVFCRYAKKNNLPIRIIKGAYLWHSYRLLKENYKDTTHLRQWTSKKTFI